MSIWKEPLSADSKNTKPLWADRKNTEPLTDNSLFVFINDKGWQEHIS